MQKGHRRLTGVALVALVALLAVVAGVVGHVGSSQAAAVKTSGHVTLNLWAYEGYNDFLPVIQKAFEKKYPNVTLNITNIPESQYTTKLQIAFAAHNPPDLAFIYDPKFLKANEFASLDDIVKPYHINLKSYNRGILGGRYDPNAQDACTYQGHIYCFGSYTGVDVLFYNRAMFRQANIPYPSATKGYTVKQFAQVACELTNKKVVRWGSAQGDPTTWGPWELVVSKNGRKVIANKTPFPQVEATVAGMIQQKCSPSLSVLDPWAQGTDYFATKKVGMVITDFQSLFKLDKAHIDWGVAVPPAPAGYKGFANIWTDNIGVTKDSPNLAAAKSFIAFQTTYGQYLRAKVTDDMPVSTVYAKKYNWAGKSIGRQEALQIVAHARPNINVPDRWDVIGPLFDAFGYIVDGKNAQQAINSAVPKVQQNLDKAWQTWESTK